MPLGFWPLSRFSRFVRWGMLVTVSAVFAVLLTWAKLPAALLLGAMVAGILIEAGQASIRLPAILFYVAQGVIGCLVARTLTLDIIHSFLQQWPVFLAIVLVIILFTGLLGWTISKLGILPGTTAIWGMLPGAATTMIVMAEANGGDVRLVAFMQYLRVVVVAFIASLIARFFVHGAPAAAPVVWFPALHWLPFIETLALVAGGVAIGFLSKLPAGMLLVPLFAGTALHVSGLVDIELPRWLLAAAYLCIGWQIGLRFTRDILLQAMRALPQVTLSIFAAILFCGGLAFALTKFLGIEPLTAYLATSPGGADGVAIIAASSPVNVGFVMALQTSRVLMVIFIGPTLSRFFSRNIKGRSAG